MGSCKPSEQEKATCICNYHNYKFFNENENTNRMYLILFTVIQQELLFIIVNGASQINARSGKIGLLSQDNENFQKVYNNNVNENKVKEREFENKLLRRSEAVDNNAKRSSNGNTKWKRKKNKKKPSLKTKNNSEKLKKKYSEEKKNNSKEKKKNNFKKKKKNNSKKKKKNNSKKKKKNNSKKKNNLIKK